MRLREPNRSALGYVSSSFSNTHRLSRLHFLAKLHSGLLNKIKSPAQLNNLANFGHFSLLQKDHLWDMEKLEKEFDTKFAYGHTTD